MSSTPKMILVVDDSLDNIHMMAEVLEHLGCEVLVATQGSQALEIAAKAQPLAIFLDVTMPQMDGIEVCRLLKANPETAQIPVFFLSGHNDPEVHARGLAVGAMGFLVKPILVGEIQAVLGRLLP